MASAKLQCHLHVGPKATFPPRLSEDSAKALGLRRTHTSSPHPFGLRSLLQISVFQQPLSSRRKADEQVVFEAVIFAEEESWR